MKNKNWLNKDELTEMAEVFINRANQLTRHERLQMEIWEALLK